jgi:ABC-2 type transport system ATP-binding protein
VDAADAAASVGVLRTLTDRDVRRESDTTVSLTAPAGDALLPAAVRALDAGGIRVARATGVPPTLDDVFLVLTGRTLREAGEGGADDGDPDSPSSAPGTDSAASVTKGTER